MPGTVFVAFGLDVSDGSVQGWLGENKGDVPFLEVIRQLIAIARGLEGYTKRTFDLVEVLIEPQTIIFKTIVPEKVALGIDYCDRMEVRVEIQTKLLIV
jgi:hypothetical protein